MYPNPSSTNLFIEYTIAANENVQVNISDVNGRLLKSSRLQANTQLNSMDVSDMVNGVYFVTLQKNGVVETTKKLVIVK